MNPRVGWSVNTRLFNGTDTWSLIPSRKHRHFGHYEHTRYGSVVVGKKKFSTLFGRFPRAREGSLLQGEERACRPKWARGCICMTRGIKDREQIILVVLRRPLLIIIVFGVISSPRKGKKWTDFSQKNRILISHERSRHEFLCTTQMEGHV